MDELTRIKLQLRDGNVTELDVLAILEVNGKPFVDGDSVDSRFDSVIDTLNHTTGRIDTLERLLQLLLAPSPQPTGS